MSARGMGENAELLAGMRTEEATSAAATPSIAALSPLSVSLPLSCWADIKLGGRGRAAG